MLPALLGMAVLTVLNVVIETLFFLPFIGKIVRFGPTGAGKDKDGDKSSHDLFHISHCLRIDTPPLAIKTLIRISLTFEGLSDQNCR